MSWAASLALAAVTISSLTLMVDAMPRPCPRFSDISNSSRLLCSSACATPSFNGTDPVFGTDIYSEDSEVCLAGVHFGAIGDGGGIVDFKRETRQHTLSGTSRNNVSSQSTSGESVAFTFMKRTSVVNEEENHKANLTSLQRSRNDRLKTSLDQEEEALEEVLLPRSPNDWNHNIGKRSVEALTVNFRSLIDDPKGLYVIGNNENQAWNQETPELVEEKEKFLGGDAQGCDSGRFGIGCSDWCTDCENGGKCHPETGVCICPPGFKGFTCQESCEGNKFGSDCDLSCDSPIFRDGDGSCKGFAFCLPSPFGCSCASGFTGPFCNEVCDDGRYGSDCLQSCSHCKASKCDRFTGRCENGCNEGVPCDREGMVLDLPRLRKPPNITVIDETSVLVSFSPWNQNSDVGSQANAIIRTYLLQIKKEDDRSWDTKETIPPSTKKGDTTKIENLESGSKYKVRILVDTNNGKLNGTTNKRIQEASFQTYNSEKTTTAERDPFQSKSSSEPTVTDDGLERGADAANGTSQIIIVAAVSVSVLLLIVIICLVVLRKKLARAKNEVVVSFTRSQDRESVLGTDGTSVEIISNTNVPPDLHSRAPAVHLRPAAEGIYVNMSEDSIYVNVCRYVQRHDIEAYISQALNCSKLTESFLSILPTFSKSMDYGARLENKKKNRYKNNLPYDETRVTLSVINDDPFSDYINANHIHGCGRALKYIATQGPKDENVNTIGDFWRMICEQEVTAIIMVANFVEGGKSKVGKYFHYGGKMKVGNYTVKVLHTQELAKYNISNIEVSNGVASHTVTHYHYTNWPDHGVPTEAHSLGSMLRIVINSHMEGCVVVHCSAGIGRTGTVLMVLMLHEMLSMNNAIEPLEVLKKLRSCRSGLVENVIQFRLGLKLFEEVEFCTLHIVQVNEFPMKLNQLLMEAGGLHMKVKSLPFNHRFSSASNPEYLSMNRNVSVLPADSSMLFLQMLNGLAPTQYINAVQIDGIDKSSSVIVTEHPLPLMTAQFWRLAIEKKCHTIVFINSFEGMETEFPVIMPLEGEETSLGPVSLNLLNVAYSDSLIKSTVRICPRRRDVEHLVTVYQIPSWPYGIELPDTPHILLGVCDLILHDQRTSPGGPTLLTCGDGVTGCGIMAALINIVDQIQRYQEVNVYGTLIRLLRTRQEFFASPAQVEFLYNAASCYIEAYNQSGNLSS